MLKQLAKTCGRRGRHVVHPRLSTKLQSLGSPATPFTPLPKLQDPKCAFTALLNCGRCCMCSQSDRVSHMTWLACQHTCVLSFIARLIECHGPG